MQLIRNDFAPELTHSSSFSCTGNLALARHTMHAQLWLIQSASSFDTRETVDVDAEDLLTSSPCCKSSLFVALRRYMSVLFSYSFLTKLAPGGLDPTSYVAILFLAEADVRALKPMD